MVFYERRTLGGFHSTIPVRARYNPRIHYSQNGAGQALALGTGVILGAALVGTVARVI